jgi:hypothetical protein
MTSTSQDALWLCSFLALPLVLFSGIALRDILRASAARQWPVVLGRLSSAEVAFREDPEYPAHPTYTPQLTYEYVVDGVAYKSSRIAVSDCAFSTRTEAEAVVAIHTSSPISVHYDPCAPERSVLSTPCLGGVVAGTVVTLLLAAGLFCMASPFLFS